MTSELNQLVITGLGLLTSKGIGLNQNLENIGTTSVGCSMEDFKVKNFNPAAHLTDRKVVKVVSHRDAIGLVAFEECLKNASISAKTINPDRTGLYVGAPPSSCQDNLNYHEAIDAAVDSNGTFIPSRFGETFRTSSPTTLLTGLPNNVLCYGSKTLDARGANSNYTCLEVSALLALSGAARSIRLGRIDCAIAGGYSAHSDKVFHSSLAQRKLKSDIPIAEAGAFVTIETRSNAARRSAKPIAQILSCTAANDALGPYKVDPSAKVLTQLIRKSLAQASVNASEIAVIMATGSGIELVDDAEKIAFNSIWNLDLPNVVATSRGLGNLMEAGGIADIAIFSHFVSSNLIPPTLLVHKSNHANICDKDRNKALIVRSSPSGEYVALIIGLENR